MATLEQFLLWADAHPKPTETRYYPTCSLGACDTCVFLNIAEHCYGACNTIDLDISGVRKLILHQTSRLPRLFVDLISRY